MKRLITQLKHILQHSQNHINNSVMLTCSTSLHEDTAHILQESWCYDQCCQNWPHVWWTNHGIECTYLLPFWCRKRMANLSSKSKLLTSKQDVALDVQRTPNPLSMGRPTQEWLKLPFFRSNTVAYMIYYQIKKEQSHNFLKQLPGNTNPPLPFKSMGLLFLLGFCEHQCTP